MTFDPFPDFEALAAQAIREVVDCGVYSSIPKTPTYPLITVKRIGGIPAEMHRLDVANLQIDVWGTTKSEARDLADEARLALHGMEGRAFSEGDDSGASGDVGSGFICAVDDSLGLTWLPDPVTARDRYVFGCSVFGHQYP